MTEGDISRIERELGIVLPPDYKDVIRNYPIRADRGTSDSVLFDEPSAIIELNRSYSAGSAGLPAWPRSYFFIGNDGAASCYFLDLTKSPSPVFFADHGNIEEIRTEAPTLRAFMDNYIAGLREDDGEFDPDAEPRPRPSRGKVLIIALVVALIAGVVGYIFTQVLTK